MGLVVPHRRPLARLAARSAIDGVEVPERHVGPYVPPMAVVEERLDQVAADVRDLCIQILRGVLLGEDLLPVRCRLATDLITWSPQLFAVSRDQLLMNLNFAELEGEMLSEVVLDVTNITAAQPRVFLEWKLAARFTSSGFIDDNLMLEPTGRLLETAGLQVVTFDRDVVVSVHCYYDDFALLEQMITPR
jgi:hypothetical protein